MNFWPRIILNIPDPIFGLNPPFKHSQFFIYLVHSFFFFFGCRIKRTYIDWFMYSQAVFFHSFFYLRNYNFINVPYVRGELKKLIGRTQISLFIVGSSVLSFCLEDRVDNKSHVEFFGLLGPFWGPANIHSGLRFARLFGQLFPSQPFSSNWKQYKLIS